MVYTSSPRLRAYVLYQPSVAHRQHHCTYPRRDGQAELNRLSGYIARWFACPKTVSHPTTNRVQRIAISLIETALYRLQLRFDFDSTAVPQLVKGH